MEIIAENTGIIWLLRHTSQARPTMDVVTDVEEVVFKARLE